MKLYLVLALVVAVVLTVMPISAMAQADAGFMDGAFRCHTVAPEPFQWLAWVPFPDNHNASSAQAWCVAYDGGRY